MEDISLDGGRHAQGRPTLQMMYYFQESVATSSWRPTSWGPSATRAPQLRVTPTPYLELIGAFRSLCSTSAPRSSAPRSRARDRHYRAAATSACAQALNDMAESVAGMHTGRAGRAARPTSWAVMAKKRSCEGRHYTQIAKVRGRATSSREAESRRPQGQRGGSGDQEGVNKRW